MANRQAEYSPGAQLEALLDTLVAAQLEMEPIRHAEPGAVGAPQHASIVTAYGVLRSAIEDLRAILQALHGSVLR